MAKFYIQRKDRFQLETVDEVTSRKEAKRLLGEYRLCDPSADYYISTRPCKSWND